MLVSHQTEIVRKVQILSLPVHRQDGPPNIYPNVCAFFFVLLIHKSLTLTVSAVHHCSTFSPFIDNGAHRVSLEFQSLRNDFVTFSQLFLSFFRSLDFSLVNSNIVNTYVTKQKSEKGQIHLPNGACVCIDITNIHIGRWIKSENFLILNHSLPF